MLKPGIVNLGSLVRGGTPSQQQTPPAGGPGTATMDSHNRLNPGGGRTIGGALPPRRAGLPGGAAAPPPSAVPPAGGMLPAGLPPAPGAGGVSEGGSMITTTGPSWTARHPENPGTPLPPEGDPITDAPAVGPEEPVVNDPLSEWSALRGQMFKPEQAEDVKGLRDLLTQNAGNLFNSPDRGELASGYMDLFNQQNSQNLKDQVRDIGRGASAFGRIGSGVTTSRVGDAFVTAEQNRANAEKGLALDAAGKSLQDRLAALTGAGGVQNMLSGQDVGMRNEGRQERGYADSLARDARDSRIQQKLLEDRLLGTAHGRTMDEARLGVQGGFGQNPAGTVAAGAGHYGGQAGAQGNAASGAIADAGVNLYERWRRKREAEGKAAPEGSYPHPVT